MQKWEYMWIYVDGSVYVANGERLQAGTYVEALNIVGQDGWELVAVLPPSTLGRAAQNAAQCCLKRPLED
jgi:hypothetical protein